MFTLSLFYLDKEIPFNSSEIVCWMMIILKAFVKRSDCIFVFLPTNSWIDRGLLMEQCIMRVDFFPIPIHIWQKKRQ